MQIWLALKVELILDESSLHFRYDQAPSNAAMMHRHLCRRLRGHCDSFSFDITNVRKRLTSTEVHHAVVSIQMDFGDSEKFKSVNPIAYITSEANTFGVIGVTDIRTGRWYDGVVEQNLNGRVHNYATITKVQETHWAGNCSKRSYYETLANQYFETDFMYLNLSFNNSTINITKIPCPSQYKCMAQTLTFNYPTCNRSQFSTEEEYAYISQCSNQAIDSLKKKMGKDFGEFSKSCVTKEYLIDDVYNWPFNGTGFSFDYEITKPFSTNKVWTDQFLKTVRQENYTMTAIGLIGIVGGTLGLFVGFTFMDSGSLILRLIKKYACTFL